MAGKVELSSGLGNLNNFGRPSVTLWREKKRFLRERGKNTLLGTILTIDIALIRTANKGRHSLNAFHSYIHYFLQVVEKDLSS